MIIDILALAVVAVCIINCFKKGFAVSLFNSLSSVTSIVIIAFFCKPFIAFVKASDLGVRVSDAIQKYVEKELISQSTQAIESSNMPAFIKGFMYQQTDSVSAAAGAITDKIFGVLVTVVAFVALVLIIKLVIGFVPKILKFIMKLPLLHQVDKLLGIAVGALLGSVWSVVVIYVIGLLSLVPALSFLDEQLANSFFLSLLNNLQIGLF